MARRICCPSCHWTGQALICPGCKASIQLSDGHSVLRSNRAQEADVSSLRRSWLISGAIAVIGVVGPLGLAAGLVSAGLALFSSHRQGPTVAVGLQPSTSTKS